MGWGWAVTFLCLQDLSSWAGVGQSYLPVLKTYLRVGRSYLPCLKDLPPWAGVGWSQSRSERRTPPPQVREHALQLDDIP